MTAGPAALHDDPVSRNLGTPDPPSAVRATTPGWRDPRLWIGVAIVAASVIAGARIVGAADDSVAVWGVTGDLGAGDTVTADDLVAHRVRFVDPRHLRSYFTADEALPADVRLTRSVGAGELLPRAAVGPAEAAGTLQLPVAVDPALVPPSVRSGAVVDVHLTGTAPGGGAAVPDRARGRAVLTGVTVVEAPPLDEGFAVSGRRQLVLAVDEQDATRYFRLVGGLDAPLLTVVRRG